MSAHCAETALCRVVNIRHNRGKESNAASSIRWLHVQDQFLDMVLNSNTMAVVRIFAIFFVQIVAITPSFPNIIETDARQILRDFGQFSGTPAGTSDRLRSAVGFVICSNGHHYSICSATIIDEFTIITSAHIIFENVGEIITFDRCQFSLVATEMNMIDIDMTTIYHGKDTSADMYGSGDWAIATLTSMPSGGRPVRLYSGDFPALGEIFVVSSFKYYGAFVGTSPEPWAQTCFVRLIEPENMGFLFYTDCDANEGNSGSPAIIFVNDEPVVVGILSKSGPPNMDGAPFNIFLGSTTVFTSVDAQMYSAAGVVDPGD